MLTSGGLITSSCQDLNNVFICAADVESSASAAVGISVAAVATQIKSCQLAMRGGGGSKGVDILATAIGTTLIGNNYAILDPLGPPPNVTVADAGGNTRHLTEYLEHSSIHYRRCRAQHLD